ncbi:MAG: RNA polymerase sigma factor [Planctomycetota bacterium]
MSHRHEVIHLALRNRTRIWSYLMALSKDPTRAEDLFQQTYLVICQKWRRYRPERDFVAWALTIARYEYLASVDPRRRREVLAEAEILGATIAEDHDESALTAARREALQHCFAHLDDRARRAFHLRYAEGLSHDAVARVLEASANAAYVLLSRTRARLRACIEAHLTREARR